MELVKLAIFAWGVMVMAVLVIIVDRCGLIDFSSRCRLIGLDSRFGLIFLNIIFPGMRVSRMVMQIEIVGLSLIAWESY